MILLGGFAAAPFATAYSASKFGLRGFSEALRVELADRPSIHICDIYTAFVDTPGLRHGANQWAGGGAPRRPPLMRAAFPTPSSMSQDRDQPLWSDL